MKTKVIILVLFLASILRWLNYSYFNADPVFYLSARNFNGRAILVAPSWLDFIIPLMFIALFWKNIKISKPIFRKLWKSIIWASAIILAGISMRYLLSNYIYENYWFITINKILILKFIIFILSFWAIELLADNLTGVRKWVKFLLLLWGVLILGMTQDMFTTARQEFNIIALLNSVGLSAMIVSWGLRPYYRKDPAGALIGAVVAGLLVVFQVVSAQSNSFFTLFIPLLAMLSLAWLASREKLNVWRVLGAVLPFILAFSLNYGLPRILPPQVAKAIIEKSEASSLIREQYHGINIAYPTKEMARFVRQLAGVIDLANRVSQDSFGISPQVNELIITGIGPGGFHAEFPHRIVGKIIDTLYMEHCMDSTFMNNPTLRADFPDPVNAILHEYCHLYGIFPYHRWLPGPEEEGWATYAATKLATLLYKQNPKLWNPPYNYMAQANKITTQNLNGKAVAWSHPDEFGGFILWYHIGKSIGLKKLFHTRWDITTHDMDKGLAYYYSYPEAARHAVKTFGKSFFEKYGQYKPVRFGAIYSGEEWMYMARTCGLDTVIARKMYEINKNRLLNPSVPIP